MAGQEGSVRERIFLRVGAGGHQSARQVNDLAQSLTTEVGDVAGVRVEPLSGKDAPPDTMAGDALTPGLIALSLVMSSQALPTLVQVVRTWFTGSGVGVELEVRGIRISLTSARRREVEELLDSFRRELAMPEAPQPEAAPNPDPGPAEGEQ
jgi:hypothetical protein